MESPYATPCEAAAPACASNRTSQHRLRAGGLNRYGSSHSSVLEAELEAGGFSAVSSSAQVVPLGNP